MTDIEAIRKRHYLKYEITRGDYCGCQNSWPCDTATVLADADALAEALQHVYGAWRVDRRDGRKWPLVEVALAAHRVGKPCP